MKKFRIGERVNSNHLPLNLKMSWEEKNIQVRLEEEESESEEERNIIVWYNEAIEKYRKAIEEWWKN